MTPTRPLLRYHGGKWKVAPWVCSHFPAHRVYVDAFGGGANVLVHKPASRTEIYNDLDGEIVNFWTVVRDHGPELAKLIACTPFSRQEFQSAYESTDDPIERARRTMVRSFMGSSSKGIWKRSGFDNRLNPDGFISRVNAFKDMPEIVLQFAARLEKVVLEQRPAIELVRQYSDRLDSLIYLDPEYLRTTHGSGKIYRHNMTESDHIDLAEAAKTVRGGVAVSGYRSDLYDELYAGWAMYEKATTADTGKKVTECLWVNRPESQLKLEL